MTGGQKISENFSQLENIAEQNEILKNNNIIPKKEIIIGNIDNVDDFIEMENFINTLDPELKSKLFFVLEKIDEEELMYYIEDNGIFNEDNINDFFDNNLYILKEYNNTNNDGKTIVPDIDSIVDKEKLKQESIKNKEEGEKNKEEGEKNKEFQFKYDKQHQKQGLELLESNKVRYQEIFAGDEDVLLKLDELQLNKENPVEIQNILKEIFSDKNKAQDFFNKIALSGDKELYEQTYNSFVNISGGQNSDVAKDFEKWGISKTLPALDPHFGVPKSQVERNGTVLSYRNMTFDMKTGESYMHSEKGYKIEIDIQKTDILETKIKYQKQRLDVLEELKDLKDFEHTANGVLKDLNENKIFDRKKELLGYVDELKASKTSSEKNGTDLGIDMEINRALKEIDLINKQIESIKEVFPFKGYANEEDYKDGLTRFLETKLIMTKQKVSELETELKDISKKMQEEISQKIIKQHNDIEKQAESKREISDFIHSIGFDVLPQSLTNQIITELKSNRLNIAGMDIDRANIDLSNGNFGEKGVGEKDSNMWKTNLVKFMEKMIYGEIGAKGSIFSGKNFKGMFGAFINPLELNHELEKNNIKTANGFDIEKIRTNLKKQNTDTQNTKETQNDR